MHIHLKNRLYIGNRQAYYLLQDRRVVVQKLWYIKVSHCYNFVIILLRIITEISSASLIYTDI